ncbi:hypothetical protein [Cochlodiniinecator piscidefendens]|uniref:hypothetical protein n=1 Tax=Cochlodiniinecator piscidefendens TaxID=2715756 RepID=UPI00140DBF97|nr:hypothetical protein [Cochlodiniinecator piscidefendens]
MLKKLLVFIALAIGCAVLAWKVAIYQHHLRFVPDEMNVWWVRYVAEERWGFGPGGNETGIIVFDMPEATFAALQNEGMDWLEALPVSDEPSWQGQYQEWQSTPVSSSEPWADASRCGAGDSDFYSITHHPICPSIASYMANFGFWISFDEEVENLANDALFSSGAFYAYDRVGMLIVIPAKQRLIYVYNG